MCNKKNIFTNKKAFTLVELIIATLISAIVLSFILIFLGDTMDNISEGKSNTRILVSFFEFQDKLNNYKNIYPIGEILLDNDTSTGSDIFLMKNLDSTDGIIISRIDLDSKKIIEDNTIYKNSPIGIRRVSKTELDDINSNTGVIRDYIFKNDKIYYDMILKDFQITSYNSGSIHEMDLIFNPFYREDFNGINWSLLKQNDLLHLNLDI